MPEKVKSPQAKEMQKEGAANQNAANEQLLAVGTGDEIQTLEEIPEILETDKGAAGQDPKNNRAEEKGEASNKEENEEFKTPPSKKNKEFQTPSSKKKKAHKKKAFEEDKVPR